MKGLKRFLSMALACCLALGLLGGCSNSEGISATDPSFSTSVSEVSPSVSDSMIENSEMEPIESQFTENISVSLVDGRNFSEGIAWVRYIDTEGVTQIGWLHSDGMIDQPFPTDMINGYGSDFSGGYSYITTGDGYIRGATEVPDSFIIMNQNGDITARSPDDESSYQILCGGDGVYLVKQSIRSMSENEDRYGFISGNGSWINECTICEAGGVHPLSLDIVPNDFDNKNISFSYLGEGIFQAVYHNGKSGSMYYHRYGVVLYNAYTKQTFVVDANTTSVFTDSSGGTIGNYSNGWVPIKSNDELYMLSADFEKKPLVTDTSDTVIFSDGVIFTGDRHYSGNRSTYLTNGKFYRTDGSVLADLSQYELLYEDTYDLYRYSNGYAAIIICGADGGQYLGIIDMDGQFSFDPIKIKGLSNWDNAGAFSSGVIVCGTADNGTQLIDTAGNQVTSDYFEMDNIGSYVFYEGYCMLNDQNGVLYISTDGSVLESHIK